VAPDVGEETPEEEATPEEPPPGGGAICVARDPGWVVLAGLEGDAIEQLQADTEELLSAWAPEVSVECHAPESWPMSPDLGLAELLRVAELDAGGGAIFSWDGERLLGGATYELQVDVTWSEQTHPDRIPPAEDFPHFSWIGGGSHVDGAKFWDVGEVASPGMRRMALAGNTTTLEEELDAERAGGAVARTFRWQGLGFGDPPGSRGNGFFAPSTTGGEFIDVLGSRPRSTLLSMLGPSTDWFVGTPPEGVLLTDQDGWRGRIDLDLRPLDGGVMDLNLLNPWRLLPCEEAPELCSSFTLPQEPIAWLEPGSYLGDASVGSFSLLPFITPAAVIPSAAQAETLDVLLGR
jgi:hypothetical protein